MWTDKDREKYKDDVIAHLPVMSEPAAVHR
jgi:hypothetical protein